MHHGLCTGLWPLCSEILHPVYTNFPSPLKRYMYVKRGKSREYNVRYIAFQQPDIEAVFYVPGTGYQIHTYTALPVRERWWGGGGSVYYT
jgi:hypothetical protein